MRRLASTALVIGAALAALALLPGTALASAYTQVLGVYQADGSIPPCRFSSTELAAAMKGVDAYGQQYFADFSDAVQSALTARASGACTPGHHTHLATAGTLPAGPPLPASVTSSTDAGVPAAILLMAAIALVLAAAVAVLALARAFGWDPPWAASWRHAWAETAYRAEGGWAVLVDWWRSRR